MYLTPSEGLFCWCRDLSVLLQRSNLSGQRRGSRFLKVLQTGRGVVKLNKPVYMIRTPHPYFISLSAQTETMLFHRFLAWEALNWYFGHCYFNIHLVGRNFETPGLFDSYSIMYFFNNKFILFSNKHNKK